MNATNPFTERRTIAERTDIWLFASAILFILLGIFAIAQPFVAGYATTMVVGWLLIFGGVMHAIGAFSRSTVGRTLLHLAVGIAYAVIGVYFVTHPMIGLATLTVLLAGLFFAEAILDFGAYLASRHEDGSGWLLVNGLVTLLLSALIGWQWPSTAVWVLGTLVGVNLLANGITRLMLGERVRNFIRMARA